MRTLLVSAALVTGYSAATTLHAQSTDVRGAVAAAQPSRYEPAGCGIKPGHFKVSSGATYLSTAIANEANRPRLLGDAQRVLVEAITGSGQAGSPAAWFYLGRVYLYQGDVIGADTALAKAEALAPACHDEIQGFRRTAAAALQEPAGLLLQAKQSDSALTVYRLAATINPSGTTTVMAVGNLFESLGQTDSALVYYRKAVGTGGSDQSMTMARLRLAGIFRQLDQIDSAAAYYAQVMHGADASGDKDSRNSAALTLAVMLYNAQRYADAIPVLRQSITWGANTESSRRLLATIYQTTGKVDSAEAELRALGETPGAVAPDTASAAYLVNRGASRFQANDPTKAAEDFERALTLEPDNRLALRNLAATYYTLKNAQKLADIAGRIVALEPFSESARRLQFQGYQWLNDRPKMERLADEMDAMTIKLEDAKFQPTADGATLTATATGRAGTGPRRVAIKATPIPVVFEFLDAKGTVVTSVEVTLPALDPAATSPVNVTATGQGITDWRYKKK
jgi:tetratricopeptide (TPR) repeat protein